MAKQSRNSSDSYASKKPDRSESTGSTGGSETRPSSASVSGSSTVTADQPPKTKKPARREPTMEDVQARAYKIFLARNGAPGDPESDWLQAERELREEFGR